MNKQKLFGGRENSASFLYHNNMAIELFTSLKLLLNERANLSEGPKTANLK